MSDYSSVPPSGAGAAALGAAGIKKDAFADAVQRARQVRETARERPEKNTVRRETWMC